MSFFVSQSIARETSRLREVTAVVMQTGLISRRHDVVSIVCSSARVLREV